MAESNSSLDANCETTKEGMKLFNGLVFPKFLAYLDPKDVFGKDFKNPKAGYIYPEMEVRKKVTKFPV